MKSGGDGFLPKIKLADLRLIIFAMLKAQPPEIGPTG
jgi:hypothetical protein